MSINRALLAALLQVMIVAAVTTNVLIAVVPAFSTALDVANRTSTPEGLPATIRTTVIPTSRILIGMIVAFIAGWWGTSGLTKRWPQQGVLIGALVAIFGLALAAASDGITTRSIVVLLDAAGAFAGAALASSALSIRRAFSAAGLQLVLTTFLGMIAALLIFALLSETRGQLGEHEEGIFRRYQFWVGVIIPAITAFLSAWWGTRSLGAEAVRHGVLIGVLAVGFSCIWIFVVGGQPVLRFLLLIPPVVGGAMAGAVFARSRDRAQQI